jgi:IS1 family transposase
MKVLAGAGEAGQGSQVGQRWGCLVIDRASRFVVAHASGPREEELAARVFAQTKRRSAEQALPWCSDGWRPYPEQLVRTYRQPVRTGRRGRPPLRLPEGVRLTQTIKHRDERGNLLRVETRATFGAPVDQPALVHVERRNGVCRDRLNALTRKTTPSPRRRRPGMLSWTCMSSSRTGCIRIRPYANRWWGSVAPTTGARPRWRSV